MNYTNPHAPGCFWHSYAETQGAPNIKWCEETLCQIVSEPANTWSNLGFLIVGFLITYFAFKKRQSIEIKQFGPIVTFMGATSFFYHQSNYYTSQVLDFVGMFFFVGWTIGMNLIRLGILNKNKLIIFNLVLAGVFTLLMHYMYLAGIKFQGIVLVSGIAIIITEFKAIKIAKINYRFFYLTLATLSCAFCFSILDGQRIWCEPTNHGWFSQGHAIWHWLCSIAMFFIYKHYSQPALSLQKEL